VRDQWGQALQLQICARGTCTHGRTCTHTHAHTRAHTHTHTHVSFLPCADGLRVLVDVLGPPPPGVLAHEMSEHRLLVDPAYAKEMRQKAVEAAEEARSGKGQGRGEKGTATALRKPQVLQVGTPPQDAPTQVGGPTD
jgi:hypothetical protein